MGGLRSLAVELVTELADELPFGPGEPFVVDRDRQNSLFLPAVPLDLVGCTTPSTVAAGMPLHRVHDRTSSSTDA
jgi:hypothetical protein